MGAVEFFQQQPVVIDAVPVLSLNSLPLGFRFRPTDEELIDFYLRQKINGKGDDVWVIREIDVCKWEPWDLPDLSVVRNKDPEWFFFCPQDRKYPNGLRLNRATSHGYWKATGKDRKIKSGSTLIGMKKTLVFYTGRAPKGNRTNWVMHEYRPTLKELDGTNPGQSPYVLCRLFKKQDESLESPNGGEVERTTSTPTTANYSPEEIQSDPTLNPVSSSQATEDDRQLAVVPENSEEAMSNIIIPVDCHSDGYDEQNQAVEPSMEDAQLLNMDIFYDPTEQFDDKFFSPVNMHILPEFNYQSNNESNGQCGVQHQYGTNETDMSEFFNSVVNWDDILYEESSSQTPNSACFDVKGSGSWINSDVGMTDTMHLQAFDASYAGEPIDTKIPLVTTKEFNAMTSNLSGNELQSNIGVFENHSHMPFSTDVSMGQVYNAASDYEQQRNFNMSGGTGIRIRPRQGRHEEPKMNPVMQSQGTAPRRIRLQRFVVHSHSSDETAVEESCASEYHNSKLATAGETKASGDHAAGESDSVTNDTEETSPELGEIILNCKQGASRKTSSVFATSDEVSSCASEDDASEDHYPKLTAAGERKASEDHASGESATVSDDADELDVISCKLAARKMSRKQLVGKAKVESFSALSETLLSRRVSYTSKSKASSNLGMWSSVFAVSATVLVLMALVFLVNPWGYLKSLKCILGYYSFCT